MELSSPAIPLLLQPLLGPGENLVWSGRPRQGLRFQAADLLLVPFSLLWGGFALVWETTALTMTTKIPMDKGPGYIPVMFPLFGLPFVAMGLYMMIGRFFFDSWMRARTAYGVTNERVIIVSGLRTPSIQSLNLKTLTNISFTENGDGTGTIQFGAVPMMVGAMMGTGWPMRTGQMPICFDSIPAVKSVHDAIRAAQLAQP